MKLVHSTRRSFDQRTASSGTPAAREAKIDAVNLHHSEWTAGLVELFHRFDVRVSRGTCRRFATYARAEMRVDAIYSDHVDRMVATVGEWSERAS